MLHSDCTSTIELLDAELASHLRDALRGIEKEGLRVNTDGDIAQTIHPLALGSTLTHPTITTDYSEALLEFITPVSNNVDDSVNFLGNLHRFALSHMDAETIWPSSMPCLLQGDESIPIANYGSSNVGQLKHVYRRGLAVRYGRVMQSIAGIHYNFSLPDKFWLDYQTRFYEVRPQNRESLQDFKSSQYFALIRNFRRYSWVLHYLFGASPALDASFLGDRSAADHGLERLGERTFGLPFATSLRMSDLGYQNSAQQDLHISYSNLSEYTQTLAEAISRPHPPYAELGVKVDGQYQQLNSNILQIENEYYSDIRPKRVTRSGEKPINALRDRGVEYIEVRILDINPYLPEGISAQQMRFMDTFLIYCLLSQCPEQSDSGCEQTSSNQEGVILRGRHPSAALTLGDRHTPLGEVADEFLNEVMQIAKILDESQETFDYSAAVYAQQAKVADPGLTPAGQMMQEIEGGSEFIDISLELAQKHRQHFLATELEEQYIASEDAKAAESLEQQKQMEAADELSFDAFLDNYNNSQ